MRPPRHLIRLLEEDHSHLRGHPDAEHPGRSDVQWNEPERQHPHTHPWVQQKIGRDDTSDYSACADQRQLGEERFNLRVRLAVEA